VNAGEHCAVTYEDNNVIRMHCNPPPSPAPINDLSGSARSFCQKDASGPASIPWWAYTPIGAVAVLGILVRRLAAARAWPRQRWG